MKPLLFVLALVIPAIAVAVVPIPPSDAVTDLQAKIDSGTVKLEYDGDHGYLKALLKNFNIPLSSQTLVFSKSSFQLHLIAPDRPRAIYFNDDTYVSWTQGASELEVSSVAPKAGPVFFMLSQTHVPHPKFERQPDINCLACHDFEISEKPVPRLLMLSVLPDSEGSAVGAASLITNDQSPFQERWGGWYVTGTHGTQRHLGNKTFNLPPSKKVDIKDYAAHADLSEGANLTDLSKRIDASKYLVPHSDIVALMILGHQTHVHNLMTLAAYRVTTEGTSDLAKIAEPLVKAMLFSDAVPFTAPVKGASGFEQEFPKQGPRDSKGRSLRDLDLKRGLLRYPLSYLIYSKSFDAMPEVLRNYVYGRLREVLTGQDRSADFAHLSAEDRKAILEILKETKMGI